MASTLAVPTIDMSRWTCGSRESRAALAVAFDTAASTVGFVQLVNHSIPAGALAGLLSAADAFFALPAEEKALASPRSTSTNRGYSPPRSESLSLSLSEATAGAAPPPPDSFEAFNVGPDDVDEADPFYAAERHRFFAPNVWPARPAGFRDAATAYFAAAHGVALALVDIFAPALRLPDGYFGRLVDRSTTTMRVINYEPSADGGACEAGAGETGGQRMGAHTDYGMVTVLYADAVPGLQVCCDGGVWRDVMPEPGALLVNFGDMMAEATNDRWKSTLHRVVPAAARRRSVAFFLDANYDATISCLPTCVDEANPARYAPFIAGDHLMAKILGPRTGARSKAVDTAARRGPGAGRPAAGLVRGARPG